MLDRMTRIVLKPQVTGDGRRIVYRAEAETTRERLRRLAEALRPRQSARTSAAAG
jgi:hypothetical protein